MLQRRNAEEKQGGPAFKYVAFDNAQFCRFADNDESKNWECVHCGRRIDKKATYGNKPIVICNNPSPDTPEARAALVPVKDTPDEVGGVVARINRAAPKYGVGFELKKIFRFLHIELPRGCVCNARTMMLNDIGIDDVEKMRNKIMLWFQEEANNRALAFDETKANKVLSIAIRRARKAALKHIQQTAKKADG
jgi:hypothetical protein